jgi:eukaryotic-like serine/threonine-protein kinase
MNKRYILLSICVALFAMACKKTISTDTPLPINYKPNVLVPTETGILYSFDAETGAKIWEFNAGSSIDCTPVMDNADVVYFGANGSLYAVDAKTGKQKWVAPVPGHNTSSPCFTFDNKIYIGGDSMHCIDLNGNKVWKTGYGTSEKINTSPTYSNGYIYFGVHFGGGVGNSIVVCADNVTGGTKWTYDAGTGSEIKGSPTVKDGKVYVSYVNGQVRSLNESNGALIWTYQCKDDVYATPMVRGDMCIVGSYDDTIRCIDAAAGTDAIRWKFGTAERIGSSATIDVDRETIYVGSNDFNMYAINHVDGSLRWKFPTASIIRSSPVLYNNKIYFTSFDKYMYAVDVATGKLVWKVNINAINSGLASPIVNATSANFNTVNFSSTYYPATSGNSIH